MKMMTKEPGTSAGAVIARTEAMTSTNNEIYDEKTAADASLINILCKGGEAVKLLHPVLCLNRGQRWREELS